MAEFKKLKSTMIPLPINDIDTDQIIPARFLKATDKIGMGKNLFADWRYLEDGTLHPNFELNNKLYNGASILVAGDNFGCGSSREHAPWALTDFGFRVIISTSFADIFKNNALKNGLLPIEVDERIHQKILDLIESDFGIQAEIDLEDEILRVGNIEVGFSIDPFSRECLLKGVDELGYILGFSAEIERYERAMHEK